MAGTKALLKVILVKVMPLSRYKEMKAFDGLKGRVPAIKFLREKSIALVESWSIERSPQYVTKDNVTVDNTNVKIYQMNPQIANKDWLEAFCYGESHNIIQISKSKEMYVACNNSKLKFTKQDCVTFLNNANNANFINLEEMEAAFKNHSIIKINVSDWIRSECTCRDWLKLYKCKHIITQAQRMGLCHWDSGKVPLAAKRKRGAARKTLSALQRQPNELQAGGITEYCNDDNHASYAEPFSQIQPLNEQTQPLNELEMIVEEPLVSLPVIDEPPVKLQKKR